MSGKGAKAARRAASAQAAKPRKVQAPKTRRPASGIRLRLGVWALLAIPVAILGLYALTTLGKSGKVATHGGGDYPYAAGSPGPGKPAPPIDLPSTTGGTFKLAASKGRETVLLYFQEGLTCQPCWDQLVAMEQDAAKFRALGIGRIVSITTDPLDLIEQKVQDEGISFPVLSDPTAKVSDTYDARAYSMTWMRPHRNGHTFILVGKDGRIMWRADYGGKPKYTMFVPDEVLLARLSSALGKQA